jgi:hypothetical protein
VNKDWLDIGILEDYLDGKLDAKTMNRVEREALDDPFVAEALAGLSESPKRSLHSLSLLQKQLQERIAHHQTVKKTSVITWQRLSIAAAAAVMFISVSIMFWMRENNHQNELAGRPKKVEVTIAAQDSMEDKAPVVAAAPAPAATVTRDQVEEKELEKVIGAAKTNNYAAARAKAKPYAMRSEAASPAVAAAPQQQNDEVVVVGFGKQKRSEVVGAIAFKAPAQAAANVLSGKVVAQNGGNPLSGAAVKTGAIRTDDIDFKQEEASTNVNQPINIVLTPKNQTLSEMVVLGYGLAKNKQEDTERLNAALAGKIAGVTTNQLLIRGADSTAKAPVKVSNPVDGWAKFFVYIQTNNAFAKEPKTGQAVELSFEINKKGRPSHIRVINSAAAKYETEAIRLISNGPNWERPKQSGSRMTFKIDF